MSNVIEYRDIGGHIRTAHITESGEWNIFVGKLHGNMKHYITRERMDREMCKRGFYRVNEYSGRCEPR